MASEQEPKLPLKLLVDKERNRVVVAEATKDFIDILFSFLTLPLGTIIRLVSKKQEQHVDKKLRKQEHDETKWVGCINNLYHCVEHLSDEVFWNHICKKMLLYPRNNSEAICQKLKLKVDDTEAMKYFMCRSKCRKGSRYFLSTFAEATCFRGKLMDKEMKLYGDSGEENHGDGVFVKGEIMYLIFDDLKVLQNSPGNSVQQLLQLGYKNFDKLTEMSLNVSLREILDLLKQALTSKSPLSDVFLGIEESMRMSTFTPKLRPENGSYYGSINLKVTVRKSEKKILYAEAEGDFVDFLFSFLTAPLGSTLKLLDGNCSLGSMSILYKSVKDLNPSWLKKSLGSNLLEPLVSLQFGCLGQPMRLWEEFYSSIPYYYGTPINKNNLCDVIYDGVISKDYCIIKDPVSMTLFEPRSPDGTRDSAVGFVRRPSLFIVWDNLQVTPLANSSSISIFQKLNVPFDDLEEHVVSIGRFEALNLLGASLTFKAALTEGLYYLLKKPKEEAKS